MGTDGATVIRDILTPILNHRPPVTDTRLLVELYKTFAKALRRDALEYTNLLTTGTINQKAWETAAKTLSTRKTRLDVWSTLFTCAMREDCWEDVRWVCAVHVSCPWVLHRG